MGFAPILPPPEPKRFIFYQVALPAFIVFNLISLGAYSCYWAYRNWKRYKTVKKQDIRPVWRGIFIPISLYFLCEAINQEGKGLENFRPIPSQILSLIMILISTLYVVDGLQFVSFFAWTLLLPLLKPIAQINRGQNADLPRDSAITPVALLTALYGIGVCLAIYYMPTPPPAVVLTAPEIPGDYIPALQDLEILEPGEEVDYFYTNSKVDFRQNGNMLTNRRVISYQATQGNISFFAATYAEVIEIDVAFGRRTFEDTEVSITTVHGDHFYLVLSTEERRDRDFVDLLEKRRDEAIANIKL